MADIGGTQLVARKLRMQGGGIDDPTPIPGDSGALFPGCVVYPWGASTEDNDRAATTMRGMTFLIPDADADIRAEDILIWRGREYLVDGEPGEWYYLSGDDACLQVNAKRWRG